MLKSVSVDWDFRPYLLADHTENEDTCTRFQVIEGADIFEPYGGLPDTYCLENTRIHQLWWSDPSAFIHLGKQLGIEVVNMSTILQPCGSSITRHRDSFFRLKRDFPDDERTRVRANIYMTPWDPGQFLTYEVDDKWYVDVEWEVGSGWMWDDQHQHISTNASLLPKYTMQINGFLL